MVVNGKQAVKMPSKDNNILKFQNPHKQLPVPFAIYADFQSVPEKIHGCQPDDKKSYTQAYENHKDCGFGYKVVCCKPVKVYRGKMLQADF